MRSVLCWAVLGGCTFHPPRLASDGGIDAAEPGTEAGADAEIDAEIDAPVPLGPWSAPTPVGLQPPSISDDDPALTDDQLELYFNGLRNANSDIFVATRASLSSPWSTPLAVVDAGVSTTANETTPEVSADGLTLVFASDRSGGGLALYQATRSSRSSPWGTPLYLEPLDSPATETAGCITPDGLAMAFTSERNGFLNSDMFYTERASTLVPWSPPVALASLNTAGYEGSPCLSADRLSIYFDANRTGSVDIYQSHRASPTDEFPPPTPVTEINTASNETDPWISPDGRTLYFRTDRDGVNGLWFTTR